MQKPLHTSNLILRPCDEADIDLLHCHWTEPEVRRYLWDGQVIDRETVREIIHSNLEWSQMYRYGLWVLLGKLDKDFRGICALRPESPARPELLYSVPASYWGSGIATESARAVLHYAFDELGLDYVTATVDKPNVVSIRVLEKLGFHVIDEKLVHGNWLVYYEISPERLLR